MLTILVLCTGNSARSVMGEALLNRLGDGRIQAYSAGSKPTGKVNPAAIRLLESKGYDTADFSSKSWDVFTGPDAPKMDIIITVCGNANTESQSETCPIWPHKQGENPLRIHMGFPDPADFGDTEAERDAAFLKVYNAQLPVLSALVALPLESMPRGDWPSALSAIEVPDIQL